MPSTVRSRSLIIVPTATSARVGTQRTCVRRAASVPAALTADRLAALPVHAVDVPVSGCGGRRIFHRRLDDGRTAGCERGAKRGTELVGRLDEHAVGAVAARNLREVGAIAGAA